MSRCAWFPPGRCERDGAEGEAALIRLIRTARLTPARGGLDGQYGQLTVDQRAFPCPRAQRLDDVGHMIGAGVGLPGLRGLQPDLEARRVQAMRIGVTPARRHGIIRLDHVHPDHRVRHHRQVFGVQSSGSRRGDPGLKAGEETPLPPSK